jgi:cytoskeletal protein RodZ
MRPMPPRLVTDPAFLSEAGLMLKAARERKGWSLSDAAKRLGLKPEQILAIEAGDAAPFRQSAQPIIWYARLYAKKLEVQLPELVFTDLQKGTHGQFEPKQATIPAFLMKSSQPSDSAN